MKCSYAQEILGEDIDCGMECPLWKGCPRLMLEDELDNVDEIIPEVLKALMKQIEKYKKGI